MKNQIASREFSLSIIVPILNESANIQRLVEDIHRWQNQGAEVIVVDGGSSDDTPTQLQASELNWCASARGRATQMNCGAAVATGTLLLFLHADTRLPDDAIESLQRCFVQTDRAPLWGRFDVSIEGRSCWFPLISALINLRSRLTGIATGDQGMFVEREMFNRVGGFPDQPLMEDIELSTRLRHIAPPRCLRQRVITSGRRWDHYGVLKTVLLMWRLRLAYWCGVSADQLAKQYR